MYIVKRSNHNPFLTPVQQEPWQGAGAFNWCPITEQSPDGQSEMVHAVYRALSVPEILHDVHDHFSSIGYTSSTDGVTFQDRRQLISPEFEWERYGCEDPRICKIDGIYYIFYTALSTYPFSPEGIKVAVATTTDFKTITEKKLVTPFNAKAMTLFPERINGKITALLSVNTDQPPAKMAIAQFDDITEMTDPNFWHAWYAELDKHVLDDARRSPADHVEVGAPPLRVAGGWLIIYSHIQNYFETSEHFEKVFGIEALLVDATDPKKILARTSGPIVAPNEEYEVHGLIPNIVFPTGALLSSNDKNFLEIYYGGADTVSCRAAVHLPNLLASMQPHAIDHFVSRYSKNPILKARSNVAWEAKAVFNPAALLLDDEIHLLYRAMSRDDTSYCGHAITKDGLTIVERYDQPAYIPRENFEQKSRPGNSGCEDPRLSRIGDTIYLCYTAYDGTNPPRVAATSITAADFTHQNWSAWKKPVLISPALVDDKDACIIDEKFGEHYIFLHRVDGAICADHIESLDFKSDMLSSATPIMTPRPGMWDGLRIGICAPPIKTEQGWLLLYHGISPNHHTYRVGAALLDIEDPTKVIARSNTPLFEPMTDYEKVGQISNVVFPCGLINKNGTLYIYYGGADSVVAVATVSLQKVLQSLSL